MSLFTIVLITEIIVLIAYFIYSIITHNKQTKEQQSEIDIIVNNAEQEIRQEIEKIPDINTRQALTRIIDMIFKGL